MSTLTPERIRQKARNLVQLAKGGLTQGERHASILALGKLLVRYPELLEDPPKAPAVTAASIVDAVERARTVANDPQVRSAVAMAGETLRSGATAVTQLADLVDALRGRKGKGAKS